MVSTLLSEILAAEKEILIKKMKLDSVGNYHSFLWEKGNVLNLKKKSEKKDRCSSAEISSSSLGDIITILLTPLYTISLICIQESKDGGVPDAHNIVYKLYTLS